MKVNHILVVCVGNICRSPVGERLLARSLAESGLDTVVSSAGIGARGAWSHSARRLRRARDTIVRCLPAGNGANPGADPGANHRARPQSRTMIASPKPRRTRAWRTLSPRSGVASGPTRTR